MNKPNFPSIEINAEFDSTEKCDLCTNSTCCTYVTQQIDTPKSKYDFEILLWQVSHKGVGAYKDEDGWFVMYDAPCSHLEMDGRCGIYDDRPTICRTHKMTFANTTHPPKMALNSISPITILYWRIVKSDSENGRRGTRHPSRSCALIDHPNILVSACLATRCATTVNLSQLTALH